MRKQQQQATDAAPCMSTDAQRLAACLQVASRGKNAVVYLKHALADQAARRRLDDALKASTPASTAGDGPSSSAGTDRPGVDHRSAAAAATATAGAVKRRRAKPRANSIASSHSLGSDNSILPMEKGTGTQHQGLPLGGELWPQPTVPRNVVERYLAARALAVQEQRLPPFVAMDHKVQELLQCLSSIGTRLEEFDVQVPVSQPPVTVLYDDAEEQSSSSGISDVDPRPAPALAELLQLADPGTQGKPCEVANLTKEDICRHHSLLVEKRRRVERRDLRKQRRAIPSEATPPVLALYPSPHQRQRHRSPPRDPPAATAPARTLWFSDMVDAEAYQRRRRWGPVLSALEHIEESVFALEALYSPGQESADRAIREAHAAEGRDLLGEGLVGEAEELSLFLRKRLEDLHDRTQLLLVYDRIRSRQHAQRSEHRATQVWPDLLAPRHTFRIAGTSAEVGHINPATSQDVLAGARPAWMGAARSSFSGVITRLGCAMRLQAVVRGHLARVIYGNVRKGLRTFFHAAEPRWRAVWTVHARGEVQAQEWLLRWLQDILDAKSTHDYLQDLHGASPMPFVRFVVHHLTRCYEAAVDARAGLLLRTLQRHKAGHPLLAVLYNVLMGAWAEEVAGTFLKALCVLAAHADGGAAGGLPGDGTCGFDVLRPRLVTPKTLAVLAMAVWPDRDSGDVVNDLMHRLDTLTRHRAEVLDWRTRSAAAQQKKPVWAVAPSRPVVKHPTENELLFCTAEVAADGWVA